MRIIGKRQEARGVFYAFKKIHEKGIIYAFKRLFQIIHAICQRSEFYLHCRGICVRLGLWPFTVSNFVLSVGQACNYKCADCGNLAPHAPAEFMRYDLKNIISDLECVFKSIDYMSGLQIQGGEPFLYSDLGELIKFISASGKVGEIVIATNGSIVPNDELLKIISDHSVLIRISEYNVTPERTEKLIKILNAKNIKYVIYAFAGGSGYWFNTGRKDFKRTDNDILVKKRFKSCAFKKCLTLERGQFARCSRGNDAPEIQGFKSAKGDYLYVNDRKNFREEFIKYYHDLKFMEACRYCNGTNPDDMIPAAAQIG